jgi:GDP-D-mannose dehydratase
MKYDLNKLQMVLTHITNNHHTLWKLFFSTNKLASHRSKIRPDTFITEHLENKRVCIVNIIMVFQLNSKVTKSVHNITQHDTNWVIDCGDK